MNDDVTTQILESLSRLEASVSGLESSVGKLEKWQLEIRGDLRRVELLLEEMDDKIVRIAEAVTDHQPKLAQHSATLDDYEDRLKLHDMRLRLLES